MLSINASFSECLKGQIDVWPKGNNTHSESIFLLEGKGVETVMLNINKLYKAFLKNGKDEIALTIVQTMYGTGDQVQLLLKPVELLQENQTYELKIEGLDISSYSKHFLKRYNTNTVTYEPITWTIKNDYLPFKPRWKGELKLIESFAFSYGDGIVSGWIFDFPLILKNEVIVHVTLQDLESNQVQTHYVIPQEGKIVIGKKLCEGAFEMNYGQKHLIRMRMMDTFAKRSLKEIVLHVQAPEIW